jgi:zinc transport system permease protein
MSEFVNAVMEHPFLQSALLAGCLAALGCGMTGTYVVVRRIGLLSGGIAHAALGGMGVAYYLGQEPLSGAVAAALVAALLIARVSLRHGEQEDTLISALWALGMAVGVIFISRTPGYNADLMSYLFGNILLVEPRVLVLMAVLDAVILAIVVLAYKPLLAVVFDEEFARIRGIRTEFFYTLMLCMVALTVVLLIPVVGLILVIALLTLPAAIAAHFARSVAGIMIWASLLGMVFTTGGLAAAYRPNLPAGATIILLAGAVYLGTVAADGALRAWRARASAGDPQDAR